MGRWIAIGRKAEWREAQTFAAALSNVDTWRPDARTTVTSVTVLEDGRLVAECHAPKLENFQAWLAAQGWQDYDCVPITYVARTGAVWKVE